MTELINTQIRNTLSDEKLGVNCAIIVQKVEMLDGVSNSAISTQHNPIASTAASVG